MKLTLDRIDLKPEFRDMPCSATKYENFNDEAQEAIKAVGRALFHEFDESNYNAVWSPKD